MLNNDVYKVFEGLIFIPGNFGDLKNDKRKENLLVTAASGSKNISTVSLYIPADVLSLFERHYLPLENPERCPKQQRPTFCF